MEEGYNKTRPLSSIFNNSHDISHPTARRRAVKYTNRRFLDGGKLLTQFPSRLLVQFILRRYKTELVHEHLMETVINCNG